MRVLHWLLALLTKLPLHQQRVARPQISPPQLLVGRGREGLSLKKRLSC